jgi:hypothetical protein
MYTVGAFLLIAVLCWLANRANDKDRPTYNEQMDDDEPNWLLLHIRQDIKLVAFMLAGIIIMVGLVADRIQ